MRYTEDELLALWKRRLGLLEADCGCTVTHADGREMDEWLRERLRSWYAKLLLEAPVELLPVRDVSDEVTMLAEGDDGRVRWWLPRDYSRLLSVRVSGWKRDVKRFEEPGSEADELARWPGLEPTAAEPMVMRSGCLIEAAPRGIPAEVLMVAPPPDGSYELHEALLERLPAS